MQRNDVVDRARSRVPWHRCEFGVMTDPALNLFGEHSPSGFLPADRRSRVSHDGSPRLSSARELEAVVLRFCGSPLKLSTELSTRIAEFHAEFLKRRGMIAIALNSSHPSVVDRTSQVCRPRHGGQPSRPHAEQLDVVQPSWVVVCYLSFGAWQWSFRRVGGLSGELSSSTTHRGPRSRRRPAPHAHEVGVGQRHGQALSTHEASTTYLQGGAD